MSAVGDRMSERVTRDRLALEVRRARRPFLVWLALLATGGAALSLLLSKLDVPWPWQHRYTVHVAVADAKGVVAGADDVRIAGVGVGRIVGVGLRGTQPVLTIGIDPKDGPLYRDAQLRLRPATPLDDMYLDVVRRGTPAAGRVLDGGTIAADRTRTPVDVSRVLDVFSADVRPREKAAIDAMGRGLADHGTSFRRALVELAPFLQAARQLALQNALREHQTRALVHHFQLMTAELAGRDRQVTRLVDAAGSALRSVASAGVPLAQLIRELPPTLRALPASFRTLRAAADQLDPTAVALRPAATRLAAAMRALRALSPDATAALRALDHPLPGLTALMRATLPAAISLRGAFAALAPQAPRLDRVTRAVIPCEKAVQAFFQWTLSVTKFSDVHGVFPRGQDVAGAATAGGAARDPNLVRPPSCTIGAKRAGR